PGQALTQGVGVTGSASDETAGTAFNAIVKAVDGSFNVVTSYAGAVGVATSDPNDTEPVATNFAAGSATVSKINKTAGSGQTITPTITALTHVTSSTYTVVPGLVTQAIIIMPGQSLTQGSGITGSASAQIVGISFDITVDAVDANFNITSYSGSVGV